MHYYMVCFLVIIYVLFLSYIDFHLLTTFLYSFLFSIVTLYYMNRISQKTYGAGAAVVNNQAASSNKKKNKWR